MFLEILPVHQTYCQMALDYPELSEDRATLQTFYLINVLAHDGELGEPWEERKANHAGETREEDLQGGDVASFLGDFFITHSIGQTLLRIMLYNDDNDLKKRVKWETYSVFRSCTCVHSQLDWLVTHKSRIDSKIILKLSTAPEIRLHLFWNHRFIYLIGKPINAVLFFLYFLICYPSYFCLVFFWSVLF